MWVKPFKAGKLPTKDDTRLGVPSTSKITYTWDRFALSRYTSLAEWLAKDEPALKMWPGTSGKEYQSRDNQVIYNLLIGDETQVQSQRRTLITNNGNRKIRCAHVPPRGRSVPKTPFLENRRYLLRLVIYYVFKSSVLGKKKI